MNGVIAIPGACLSDLNALIRLDEMRDHDLRALREDLHPIHHVPDVAM